MPRRQPVPGRTADLRRTARLTLEALGGRDVPALLGLNLPASLGLDVPLVSDRLNLDLGVSVRLGTNSEPESAGLQLSLGRLASIDVGLPSAPDVIVAPPIDTTPPTSPESPPVVLPTPPIATPPTPILTDSAPPSPVVGQPVEPADVVVPTVTPPVTDDVATPEVEVPPTPVTPSESAAVSPPTVTDTAAGVAAFAPPDTESSRVAAVAAVVPVSVNESAELQPAGEQPTVAMTSGMVPTEAAPLDSAGAVVPPTPTPEATAAPKAPVPPPGEYPVDAAELLSRFSSLELYGVGTQPSVVLDDFGAILPDASDLLGERGWWYAAALATMYAGRKVVIARSKQARRPFALPA